jgi:hypothetical protein
MYDGKILSDVISQLVSTKKENDYYDFKRQWHEKTDDLIHDIICMANVITHEGDRYIIFGIDNQFNAVGIENDENRKDQQKVICVLKDHDFNGDYRPDIEVATITLEEKTLDVLIIKDKPLKPYLLRKANKDEKIRPCIYTRVGDTNTSIDSSADYNHIEKMFEERFGLNRNPLSRMTTYLLDYSNWEDIAYINDKNITQYYYTKFPEFTIQYFNDSTESTEWPEEDIMGKPFKSNVVEYLFHSTVLHRSFALTSQDARLCFPKPDYCKSFHYKDIPYFVYYNCRNTITSNVKYLLNEIYNDSLGPHQSNHYQFIEFEDDDEKTRFYNPDNQKLVFDEFFSSGHKEKKNNDGIKENHKIEKEFRIFAWEYFKNWQVME